MNGFAEVYRQLVVRLNCHMKRIRIFGMGVLLWASINSHAAQTAQARLFSLSVRFQRGTDMFGLSVLDLSTIGLDAPNGELAPTFSDPDHSSGFRISDPDLGEIVEQGEIDLNTPDFDDVNGDGFDDFFDARQAVSGVSTGIYSSVIDSGTVKATWGRSSGSKEGTCVLSLKSKMVGPLGDFTHTFELLEYKGLLNYAPGTNKVSGTLNLTQTGDPTSQLAGPTEFTKSPTNRFDELNLRPEIWTNASSQRFPMSKVFDSFPFLRDLALKTNYYGFLVFEDGDPNTSGTDYLYWFLSIDDVNDSDGDGIPDFSDDPGSGIVQPPTVLLSLGNTNLSFSISSTVGRTVEIQEITSLSETNWATVNSFVPTNDPQVVPLPRPTEGTKFWRLRIP